MFSVNIVKISGKDTGITISVGIGYDIYERKKMKNRVCALVVTYNRLELLKENNEALRKQSFPCDIFIVNNHSTDDTRDYLDQSGIRHYDCEENLGGAGGFNIGIRKIAKAGYDFIWLMDDDCIPNEDALEKLMEADEKLNSEYGFLASRVLWTDGSDHAMNRINDVKYDQDHIYKTEYATFVSILLKRETVEKVGLPIREFFIWGDDIEYTRRITMRNHMDSYYIDDSIVIHKTKTNIGSKIAFDDISGIARYRYAYRNEAYLYAQEGIRGRIYYGLKCLYNIARIIFLAKDHKLKRLKVLLNGVKEGLSFDPKEEYL